LGGAEQVDPGILALGDANPLVDEELDATLDRWSTGSLKLKGTPPHEAP
jgi:hypothetical protein